MRTWIWLEKVLFADFAGGTVAPGNYQGFYEDPDTGEVVRDRSRKFIVAIPRDALGDLRNLLREACERFAQKCIYLSVAGQVEFVRP